MSVSSRLKIVRESLSKTQKEMAALAGVGHRTWQNYEEGVNKPGWDALAALAGLGINFDWLATGEGPMHRDQVERPPESYSEEQIGWDSELMTEIIQKYEKALTEQKAYVSPEEKGKMYAKLYEIYRVEKVAIDDNEVRRTLKLVVNQS